MANSKSAKRVVSVSVRRSGRDGAMVAVNSLARQPVTDGMAIVRLDPALLSMIREHIVVIRSVYPDLWDVPSWDCPWTYTECDQEELLHSIGFIAGVAATLNKTPRELCDALG